MSDTYAWVRDESRSASRDYLPDTPDHSDMCTDQACTSCATLWRAS